MVSNLHEALVEMFRSRPTLAVDLLVDALGRPVPEHEQVRLDPADLTDLVPTEFRADAVVVLVAGVEPVLALVVEIQLGRDTDKRFSWPVYIATVRARLRCPVELLAVCPDAGVAAWCARPIPLGLGGSSLVPIVIGPDRVPVVTDPDLAQRAPELTVLSALAHGADPARRAVLDVLFTALDAVDADHELLYLELVHAALPDAARRHLEALMTTPIDEIDPNRSPLTQWLFAKGEARGEAKALLAVLAARGVSVPPESKARIAACTDLDQLDSWVRRAVSVTAVEELFT